MFLRPQMRKLIIYSLASNVSKFTKLARFSSYLCIKNNKNCFQLKQRKGLFEQNPFLSRLYEFQSKLTQHWETYNLNYEKRLLQLDKRCQISTWLRWKHIHFSRPTNKIRFVVKHSIADKQKKQIHYSVFEFYETIDFSSEQNCVQVEEKKSIFRFLSLKNS